MNNNSSVQNTRKLRKIQFVSLNVELVNNITSLELISSREILSEMKYIVIFWMAPFDPYVYKIISLLV